MLKEYIQGVRSLSIIGMCKNAGKTTVRGTQSLRLRQIWAQRSNVLCARRPSYNPLALSDSCRR